MANKEGEEVCGGCGVTAREAEKFFGHPLIASDAVGGGLLCWECLKANDPEMFAEESAGDD